MAAGIDTSSTVAVFVTRNYIEKVAKETADNCKMEFGYALQKKGPSHMFAIVMEPRVRDTKTWYVNHTSPINHHTSPITHHPYPSLITHHTSPISITHHPSHITHHTCHQ